MIKEKGDSESATAQVQQRPRILNQKELDSLKRKLEELMNWTFSYKKALDEKVLEYRKQFMSHHEVIEDDDNCKEKLAKFEIVVEQTFRFMDDLILAMRNMLDIIKQQVKINMQEAKINQQEMLVNQQAVTINQQEMTIYQQEVKINQREAKINQQEVKIHRQELIANQQETMVNKQGAKIKQQEEILDQQAFMIKQQGEIINEQEAKIDQLEAYAENLKNTLTRVKIYTYRDWVGKFRRLLVAKINEKQSRRFNDWFALERELNSERKKKRRKKAMTEHLESVLREFGMTMNDFDLLSDLKAESNSKFHNNETVKDAKNYLNRTIFPDDMEVLKNPLQKALDAIEKEHVVEVVVDDDDDDDDDDVQ